MLYPGVVYGPGEMTDGNLVVKMVADHLRGRFPGLIGPGDRLWSYAFVEDVAEGHAFALERGGRGQRYFLGGGKGCPLSVFTLLQAGGGGPPPRRHLPLSMDLVLVVRRGFQSDGCGPPPRRGP